MARPGASRAYQWTPLRSSWGVALLCGLAVLLAHPWFLSRVRPARSALISVIVPCYNVNPDWLGATLDAIDAQSIAPLVELILVDDGSSSPVTRPALHRVAACRLYRHWTNRGLSATRNTGAALASGRYLVFLDPDDLMETTALEKMVTLLEGFTRRSANRVGYIYPAVVHFADDPSQPLSIERHRYDTRRLVEDNFIPSFALLPRALYLAAGGMCEGRIRHFEDYDFWLRLASLGIQGHLLNEALFFYRRHAHGRSHAIRSAGRDWIAELQHNNPIAFGLQLRGSELDGETLSRAGPCHRPLPAAPSLVSLWLWRWGGDWWRGLEGRATWLRASTPSPELERHLGAYNVMLIVPWLEVGGADYYDLDFVKLLASLQLRVLVVVDVVDRHARNHLESTFQPLVAEIIHLATLLPPEHDQEDVDQLLLGLYRRKRPRLVYIRNSMNGYRLARRVKAEDARAAVWDVQHLASPPGDTRGWEYTTIPYAPFLDRRIVVSRQLRTCVLQRLAHAGLSRAGPVHVIPPAVNVAELTGDTVDCRSVAAARQAPACASPRYRTIVFVGRMQEQKDPVRWVQVAARLAECDPTLLFLMIGEGHLLDQVRQHVATLPALQDRLLFLPFLERARLAAVLQAGLYRDGRGVVRLQQDCCSGPGQALLLMTSENEGLPYVVLEALTLGLGVVMPPLGAIQEVAGRMQGQIILAADRSIAALVHAVLGALAPSHSSPSPPLPLPLPYTIGAFRQAFQRLLQQTDLG